MELLPEDWPQPGLRIAIERFIPLISGPAEARIRELVPEIEIPKRGPEAPAATGRASTGDDRLAARAG
jgi:hypothetical protein